MKADGPAYDPAQLAPTPTQTSEGLQQLVGSLRSLVARNVADRERDLVHGDHQQVAVAEMIVDAADRLAQQVGRRARRDADLDLDRP